MKRILGILAIIVAMAPYGYAQDEDTTQNQGGVQMQNGTQDEPATLKTDNSYMTSNIWAGNYPTNNANDDPFFNFNGVGDPKEISKLGTDPEFTFLENRSTTRQVYNAIKKHSDNSKLNGIMLSLGFTNGISDLQESHITAATIPSGTNGNMGAGNGNTGYYKLVSDNGNGFKAWKVTNDANGSYVFFLQACGNEFYPNSGKPAGTACVTAPLNVTTQPVDITSKGQQVKITDKTYVYYHIKGRRDHKHRYTNAAIADNHPSKPLLLSTTYRYELVPETYKVTVAAQDPNITVCPDSAAQVAANINVEKTSSYTGNYPGTENKYTLVSKRGYMRAERKMRKAERKEEKVARITKTPVDVDEDPDKTNI